MSLIVTGDLCVVLTTVCLYQYVTFVITTVNGHHALATSLNCPYREAIQNPCC